jgi:hypothetical protein
MTTEARLPEEIREKLRGVSALSDRVEFKIETPEGVPDEYTPRLFLKSVSMREIEDLKKADEEAQADFGRRILVGWKNLYNLTTGEKIEFRAAEDGGCDRELYRSLNYQIIKKVVEFSGELFA